MGSGVIVAVMTLPLVVSEIVAFCCAAMRAARVFGGHELVARVVGVGDEVREHLGGVTRIAAGAVGVPIGRAIVVPRPYDDRHLRVGRELIEQRLPVGQRLRGCLVLKLDFGEIEGDVGRDIDRAGIGRIDVAEGVGIAGTRPRSSRR